MTRDSRPIFVTTPNQRRKLGVCELDIRRKEVILRITVTNRDIKSIAARALPKRSLVAGLAAEITESSFSGQLDFFFSKWMFGLKTRVARACEILGLLNCSFCTGDPGELGSLAEYRRWVREWGREGGPDQRHAPDEIRWMNSCADAALRGDIKKARKFAKRVFASWEKGCPEKVETVT